MLTKLPSSDAKSPQGRMAFVPSWLAKPLPQEQPTVQAGELMCRCPRKLAAHNAPNDASTGHCDGARCVDHGCPGRKIFRLQRLAVLHVNGVWPAPRSGAPRRQLSVASLLRKVRREPERQHCSPVYRTCRVSTTASWGSVGALHSRAIVVHGYRILRHATVVGAMRCLRRCCPELPRLGAPDHVSVVVGYHVTQARSTGCWNHVVHKISHWRWRQWGRTVS